MAEFKMHHFAPGDEPEVLTANLCETFGCATCPGITTATTLSTNQPRALFCIHECHEERQ